VEGVNRPSVPAAIVTGTTAAQFSFSKSGSLVYMQGPNSSSSAARNLVISDRKGVAEPLKAPPRQYFFPRVSPDGTRIVLETDDGREAVVWTYRLDGTSQMQRLTFDGNSRFPIWSRDGQWVVFQSDREGDLGIFRQRADGTAGSPERLTRADTLLFNITEGSSVSLAILSLADHKIAAFPGFQSTGWPAAAFSPDGRWVAYSRREPNQLYPALYVEPFPPTGEKHQVIGGEHFAVWSPDQKALFFIAPQFSSGGRVGFAGASVTTSPGFAIGQPEAILRGFDVTGMGIGLARTYDILRDGRFIGVVDAEQPEATPRPQIQVVINWFEELKRLVPKD
jgi:eukaryotic-like serine/threonine-protein kinase